MNVRIEESWRKRLQDEFDKPYFERLVSFVRSEYGRTHVLPPGHLIFHVFDACPFESVRVVILGQDPYPNPGQYYGVCFSVPEGGLFPDLCLICLRRYMMIWASLFPLRAIWIGG